MAERLAGIGFEGWVVVEAEPDPAQATLLDDVKIGRAAVAQVLTIAGYRIVED